MRCRPVHLLWTLSGCSTANVTDVCGQSTCTPGEFGYTCGERTKARKTLDAVMHVDPPSSRGSSVRRIDVGQTLLLCTSFSTPEQNTALLRRGPWSPDPQRRHTLRSVLSNGWSCFDRQRTRRNLTKADHASPCRMLREFRNNYNREDLCQSAGRNPMGNICYRRWSPNRFARDLQHVLSQTGECRGLLPGVSNPSSAPLTIIYAFVVFAALDVTLIGIRIP